VSVASPIESRYKLTDAVLTLVIVGIAAALGVLVHPLLWSITVLAAAWLVGGRSPYNPASKPGKRPDEA
jgi:hypothetical protein